MDPADRWHLTLAALLGQPLPPLPDLPGRKHVAPAETRDRVAEAWDALHSPARGGSGVWGWTVSKAHHEAGR